MTSNLKTVSAIWKSDLNFIGENPDGGAIAMGTTGEIPRFSPVELVLVGLAGCTGTDVVTILQKKRAHLTDLKVNVRGKRAESAPKIYTDVEVEYIIWGKDIKQKDVEQAIILSEEKYCSVSIMVGKTANITSSYKILKPGESVI